MEIERQASSIFRNLFGSKNATKVHDVDWYGGSKLLDVDIAVDIAALFDS